MLRKALAAVRRNVLASLAFAVAVLALAGGAYATLRLPAGSVTDRSIANHTITPAKLNLKAQGSFGGYVRDWAVVGASGQVTASSSHPATEVAAVVPPTVYTIAWNTGKFRFDPISRCLPEVTVQGVYGISEPGAFATAVVSRTNAMVHTYNASGVPTPEPFYLVVIC